MNTLHRIILWVIKQVNPDEENGKQFMMRHVLQCHIIDFVICDLCLM